MCYASVTSIEDGDYHYDDDRYDDDRCYYKYYYYHFITGKIITIQNAI